MSSNYRTLSAEAEGEVREKASKFLAYAYPIENESEIIPLIEIQRKNHPKARHWCYAWRIGLDKNHYRVNDDGEPSGTAGKPILGQIDSFGLTNVLIIVVRYFGGTLLGTSGLIQAYRDSAKMALADAKIIEKQVKKDIFIAFDYALMSDVMNACKKLDLVITEKNFDESPSIIVAIAIDEVDDKWLRFKANILKVELNQAAGISKIGGIEWRERECK